MHLFTGRNTRNVLSAVMLAITAAVCSITMPGASAEENYRSWSQLDPRWSSDLLGTEAYTSIGSSGCLVTSLAMLAVHTGVKNENDFNPGSFADSLKSVNAFNQWGGLANWLAVNKVIPEMSIVWQPDKYSGYWGTTDKDQKIAMLRQFMADGYWPLVNVNTHHWVVVDRVTDDTVYMLDPASDDTDMFAHYGNITRTDKNDFDYILVKSAVRPADIDASDKVSYEPSIKLSIEKLPDITTFNAGQFVDLSSGSVSVTVVDRLTGPKNFGSEPMDGNSPNFNIYAEYHGPGSAQNVLYKNGVTKFSKSGPHTIALEAIDSSGMFAVSFFDIQIENNGIGTPVDETEYFNSGSNPVAVLSAPDDSGVKVTSVYPGGIVCIDTVFEDYGKVVSQDFSGWVKLDVLAPFAAEDEHIKGDINGDSEVDITDLALLNEYFRKRSITGDGISLFSKAEFSAADTNGDGDVNEADLLSLLDSICK